jgi:hypothetical protein
MSCFFVFRRRGGKPGVNSGPEPRAAEKQKNKQGCPDDLQTGHPYGVNGTYLRGFVIKIVGVLGRFSSQNELK